MMLRLPMAACFAISTPFYIESDFKTRYLMGA